MNDEIRALIETARVTSAVLAISGDALTPRERERAANRIRAARLAATIEIIRAGVGLGMPRT